jgi:hypothetical protein
MRLKSFLVVVVLLVGVLAVAGIANARAGAETKVTIKEQNGDFSGKVKSDKQKCVEERKVTLWRAHKNKDDEKIATDTTGSDGEWSTGNTGAEKGKYYAKAGKVSGCKKGISETVKVQP